MGILQPVATAFQDAIHLAQRCFWRRSRCRTGSMFLKALSYLCQYLLMQGKLLLNLSAGLCLCGFGQFSHCLDSRIEVEFITLNGLVWNILPTFCQLHHLGYPYLRHSECLLQSGFRRGS
jgi:hypothetical protein